MIACVIVVLQKGLKFDFQHIWEVEQLRWYLCIFLSCTKCTVIHALTSHSGHLEEENHFPFYHVA